MLYVCTFPYLQIHYPDSYEIEVFTARSRRMKIGRCIQRDYGYSGCSADVKFKVTAWCSGRLSYTHTDWWHELRWRKTGCPAKLTKYLEMTHVFLQPTHAS